MFLQVSVILFTGGCLPQCILGYPPPGADTPQSRPPLEADTPLQEADTPRSRHPQEQIPSEQTPPEQTPPEQTPPRSRHPPEQTPPTPWSRQPPQSRHPQEQIPSEQTPPQSRPPQSRHPPEADIPRSRHPPPPGADNPPRADTPPGSRHPPWEQTYTPPKEQTPPEQTHPCRACWEIRSTHGRYAFYWNAILLLFHLTCFFRRNESVFCKSRWRKTTQFRRICLFTLDFTQEIFKVIAKKQFCEYTHAFLV